MSLTYNYIDNGQRNTIGLVHGFGFTPEVWNNILPYFSAQYNVVVPDLNSMSAVKSGFTLKDIAFSLTSVQNKLSVDSIVWFGHSMGGYVLAEMIAYYPQKIKGASLIHAHVFGDSEEKKSARDKQIAFVRAYGVEKFFRQMISTLFYNEADRKAYLDTCLSLSVNIPKEFVIDALLAMKNRSNHMHSFSGKLLPLQIILGDNDPLLGVGDALKMLNIVSLCNITILKDCAHLSMLEKKEELVVSMLNYSDYCFNF
jgi:pimeloyl-ACP methyl ester carboxylesterase